MPRPKAPRWTAHGDIPDINPESARDDQLELLDEDMLQMTDPTGRYAVDVGWYPAASRDGNFICRVVRSQDWDRPLEQMETPNIKLVWKWLRHQINEVNTLVGQLGGFTTKIGLFVYTSVATASKSKKKIKSTRPQVIQAFLKPLTAMAAVPLSLFAGEPSIPRTTNPSTSSAIGIGLGAGLALHGT